MAVDNPKGETIYNVLFHNNAKIYEHCNLAAKLSGYDLARHVRCVGDGDDWQAELVSDPQNGKLPLW